MRPSFVSRHCGSARRGSHERTCTSSSAAREPGLDRPAAPGQAIVARAVMAVPKSSVRLGGVTERVDGVWAGAAFGFDAGRFLFTAGGTRGTLTAFNRDRTQAGCWRDLGERPIRCPPLADPRPWIHRPGLQLGSGLPAVGYRERRCFGVPRPGDAGGARRRSPSLVARREDRRPTGSIFRPAQRRGALRRPQGSPLTFTLGYRVERFHFSRSAVRSEQFEALTLSAGVRAQRVDGRWRLGG